MNVDPTEDGYEAHCVNCGAGYNFEVGFTLGICPACGRSQTETLSAEAERKEREAEHARRFEAGEIQRDNMVRALDEYINEFDLLAPTPDAKQLAALVVELRLLTGKAKLVGRMP